MKLVAEIGCNHGGSVETAKEMIRSAAVFCMVDVVKFQKRNPHECLTVEEYNAPHPDESHAFGDTYGAHREHLEFTPRQHAELKKYANKLGVEYACSVFDVTSIKQMAKLKPAYIKIGSGHNLKWDLYDALFKHWKGEIHVSTGATKHSEITDIVDYFRDNGREPVLYLCTSAYPAQVIDLCLNELGFLGAFGCATGFSGHHTGISPDLAAVTMGVQYVERHFTLDRASKGTDHAASLEPDGMRKLSKYIKDIKMAMRYKEPEVLMCEMGLRNKKCNIQ